MEGEKWEDVQTQCTTYRNWWSPETGLMEARNEMYVTFKDRQGCIWRMSEILWISTLIAGEQAAVSSIDTQSPDVDVFDCGILRWDSLQFGGWVPTGWRNWRPQSSRWIEALGSFGGFVLLLYKSTRRHIPVNCNLHSHQEDRLKPGCSSIIQEIHFLWSTKILGVFKHSPWDIDMRHINLTHILKYGFNKNFFNNMINCTLKRQILLVRSFFCFDPHRVCIFFLPSTCPVPCRFVSYSADVLFNIPFLF
jgi:hypothetical protein